MNSVGLNLHGYYNSLMWVNAVRFLSYKHWCRALIVKLNMWPLNYIWLTKQVYEFENFLIVLIR